MNKFFSLCSGFIFNTPPVEKICVYMRFYWNFWFEMSSARHKIQLSFLHENEKKAYTVNRVETQPVLNSAATKIKWELDHNEQIL